MTKRYGQFLRKTAPDKNNTKQAKNNNNKKTPNKQTEKCDQLFDQEGIDSMSVINNPIDGSITFGHIPPKHTYTHTYTHTHTHTHTHTLTNTH